jgi:hypothetical protein
MKKIISILALVAMTGAAFAQDVSVGRRILGSGTPGLVGDEVAKKWDGAGADQIYQIQQYMPGYPTSATIWPRVVEVPCTIVAGKSVCGGYDWQPRYGRGEYLFVRPVALVVPEPKVIIKEVVKVVEVPCCHRDKPLKE